MATEPTLPIPPPVEDAVDALVAECLARLSHDGVDPLPGICAQHPQHAAELRRRQVALAALGLWSRADVRPNDAIGPFELIRELGRGGMGVVWLAQQRQPLRRLVAVKVIEGRASINALARFEAERQALAMLVHPGIAQVFEAGRTSAGTPWYAMEFVDGRPLTAWCAQRRSSIDERLRVFLQLCDAVQFAHQQGVLHRDLKPGNVLVCERGGEPLVKVIDFGLAKALEASFVEARELTEAGQILGTPEYMSPEQAMPTAAGVDTRTDVYALGTILFELCTGLLPFDFAELRRQGFVALQRVVCETTAPTMGQRLRAAHAEAAVAAAEAATTDAGLRRRLRGDLEWIVGRALAKERDRRYATVAELAADVRRHLQHEPVLAGPPSARYVLGKFVRRHRVGVVAAAVLLVGFAAALAFVFATQRQHLARFDSLQVAIDLERLLAVSDDLWPARPATLPAFDAWLGAATALRQREPELRALHGEVAALGEGSATGLRFARARDAYLHDQLGAILARFAPDGAFAVRVADVTARRDWAAALTERSLVAHEAAWRAAVDTIADPTQCPDYGGLRITPQVGFVPLGRDDRTRLFEFAYLQPGERLPERRDGRWVVELDTCMVFVLIPGGEASLGIKWPDPRLPEELEPHGSEYLPPLDGAEGGRSVPVRLHAFLLSKYEMTQAQWLRTMGSLPSTYSPLQERKHGVTRTHPVGAITNDMAVAAVRRLGLSLPTAAQWQYAARARSSSPWWTGFSTTSWYGHENLSDASNAKGGVNADQGPPDLDHDDGFALSAPVDALSANPFGLHHVIGNVREHSSDCGYKYVDATPRDGDGAALAAHPDAAEEGMCDVLGGSYMSSALRARSTLRTRAPRTQGAVPYGLRPARALDAP